jgi:hypothetical protein
MDLGAWLAVLGNQQGVLVVAALIALLCMGVFAAILLFGDS